MKRIVISLLALIILASVSTAELLVPANPLGKGKIAILGAGAMDQNLNNISGMGLTSICGTIGYGLTESLDGYLTIGSSNGTGLPLGLSAYSATQYTGNLKYTVVNEGVTSPVSVAIGVGVKSVATNSTYVTPFPAVSGSLTQMGGGLIVSKMMIPFIPYAGLVYRKTTLPGADFSSQIDLTIGSEMAFSKQFLACLEATMQSISPVGGSNYSGTQIALGAAYILN